MKNLILVALMLGLAGCGGGKRDYARGGKSTAVMRSASGPISQACMASDRKARSPALCGCVQAAANMNLSSNDQRLAASFFSNPHRAQEIRQSDNAGHEKFWKKYKEFSETAEAICS